MPLSNDQISTLLNMVSSAKKDSLDCDGCFKHLAQFADAELAGREIPEALKSVQTHLQQCGCCKVEYQALLEGLRAIAEQK